MNISTFLYSYDNTNFENEENDEHVFDDIICLSDFYLDPPENLVKDTIKLVLNLSDK